jgi:hypothetical protein
VRVQILAPVSSRGGSRGNGRAIRLKANCWYRNPADTCVRGGLEVRVIDKRSRSRCEGGGGGGANASPTLVSNSECLAPSRSFGSISSVCVENIASRGQAVPNRGSSRDSRCVSQTETLFSELVVRVSGCNRSGRNWLGNGPNKVSVELVGGSRRGGICQFVVGI